MDQLKGQMQLSGPVSSGLCLFFFLFLDFHLLLMIFKPDTSFIFLLSIFLKLLNTFFQDTRVFGISPCWGKNIFSVNVFYHVEIFHRFN